MAVFTLTLVRHGETLANKQSILQGQLDTELSDKGVRQAQLLGMRLQQDHFTHVYTSDLKRAYQTCENILKFNTCTKCQTIPDRRLRERKFGVMEGKHRSEFVTALKKSKDSGAKFTPSGGETNQEVRARGINFFQDLCKMLLEQVDQAGNGNEDLSVSIKKRRYTASTSSDVFPSPVEPVSFLIGNNGSDSGSVDSQNNSSKSIRNDNNSGCGEKVVRAKSRTHASSGSVGSIGSTISSGSVRSIDSTTSGCSSSHTVISSGSEELSPDIHTKDVTNTSNVSSSQHQLSVSLSSRPEMEVKNISTASSMTPVQPSEAGPPNVSLSPITEHRLSSLSSISSGRNNSFDDSDLPPALLGEVLVVTHGGLLRQLLSYFVDELGCKIPGGKNHALQTTPNTGLSKFTVSLNVEGERPMVTCLSIHDQDHLLDQEFLTHAASAEDLYRDVTPIRPTRYDL